MKPNLARALAVVRESQDHIVLQRVVPRTYYHKPDGTHCLRAVFLDTETTGLETDDAIIELAVVGFDFDPISGRIFGVESARAWLEDPERPLSAEITKLTGITDEMVRGQAIADEEVMTVCRDAQLIIAHNAAFDRPMVERRMPWLAERPWACSQYDINWRKVGYSSLSMDYLVMKHARSFHGNHRATTDVIAGVHVLATPFSNETWPMKELYERANLVTYRIKVIGAPFEMKDRLKARRYRWDPGNAERERAWWIEVPGEALAAEQEWLGRNVRTSASPTIQKITARDRYSERVR